MKKKLKNKKAIIILIGIILLSGITYVAAKTLINSKDVIYTDTYNLGAENVQAAIDGTCSKIDTRLSAIEDKLYTVKNFDNTQSISPTTEFSYTGIYVTLPAKSYCSVTGWSWYNRDMPVKVALNRSPTNSVHVLAYNYPVSGAGESETNVTADIYTDTALTVYLWMQFMSTNDQTNVGIRGFCATKYKQ